MSAQTHRGKLDLCLVTCLSTATSRTSGASSSPQSKGTTVHFVTEQPSPRAAPAVVRLVEVRGRD
jgi:hypothetical protein